LFFANTQKKRLSFVTTFKWEIKKYTNQNFLAYCSVQKHCKPLLSFWINKQMKMKKIINVLSHRKGWLWNKQILLSIRSKMLCQFECKIKNTDAQWLSAKPVSKPYILLNAWHVLWADDPQYLKVTFWLKVLCKCVPILTMTLAPSSFVTFCLGLIEAHIKTIQNVILIFVCFWFRYHVFIERVIRRYQYWYCNQIQTTILLFLGY
jgi:hypothetical protein